ncbi:MAG TPA: peptide-binding protein, partial [Dysgonomonas sp.]|nr:peptide-binding protein [Dysgonomonas sp.]
KIAKTPTLPLFIIVEQNEDSKLYKWMRAEFKDMATEGERSATGMSSIAGIIVISIDNGSPLKKAGLQTNDVILAVNGKNTDKWADFAHETSTVQKGTSMQIRIFRDQREYTVPFTVE